MITGFLNFNNNDFFFHLYNCELTLTSLNQEKQYYIDAFFEFFEKKEEIPDVLEGRTLNSRNTILFFIKRKITTSIGSYKFEIDSYIEYEDEIRSIERLTIYSKELDWFYNLNKSYDYEMMHPTGEINLRVNSFDLNTDHFSFLLDKKPIEATFSIERNIARPSNNPVTLNSTISFTFEKNNDHSFFMKIVSLTRDFLKIVSYRRNITINHVILKEKNEMGKFRKIGILIFPEQEDIIRESEKYTRERIIDFEIIQNNITELFQLLATEQLYKEHIPQNSQDKNFITPARFILITAAFEWEFRSSYGNVKETENSSYREIQTDVMKHLEELISNNSGKKKKYAKSLYKVISNSSMSLSEKILRVLQDSEGILNVFINNLYLLNGIEKVKHSDMAERIQIQRNNYAHGNIDKELNFLVILDLIVLEWAIYVLILRKARMNDEQISHSINKLFARNFNLKPLKS